MAGYLRKKGFKHKTNENLVNHKSNKKDIPLEDYWSADFETDDNEKDVAWVWLGYITNVLNPKENYAFYSIEEFLYILSQPRFKHKSIVFFHNLKFDARFIIAELNRQCYRYDMFKNEMASYKTSISDMGEWYSVEAYIPSINDEGRQEARKIIRFWDSAKRVPGKLRDIAIAWGVDTPKEYMDYTGVQHDKPVYNQLTHEYDYISNISAEEKHYCFIDTKIVADVNKMLLEQGFTEMTMASHAIKLLKKSIGKLYWDAFFVPLDKDTDAFIRKAYRGGICMYNEKLVNKVLTDIRIDCYDVNSMYPAQMVKAKLPIGEGIYYEGKWSDHIGETYDYEPFEARDLYVQRMLVNCRVKEDYPACILMSNKSRGDSSFLKSTENELVEITLTNIDIEMLEACYEIYDIKYLDGYAYRGKVGVAADFVLYHYGQKSTSTGSKKQYHKTVLNSTYGKTAQKLEAVSKVIKDFDKGIMHLMTDSANPQEKKSLYLPYATFVTAYARKQLVTAILNNLDRFVYCDTDSVFLLRTDKPVEGLAVGKSLGEWDLEKTFDKFKVLRQKTYMGHLENVPKGQLYIKMVGVKEDDRKMLNWDNFCYGTVIPVRKVCTCIGGAIFLPSNHIINEPVS